MQRPLDGVLRRLVAQHPHRVVHVGRAACLHRDVEELARDHLRAAPVEEGERRLDPVPAKSAAAQQLVGPGEQQVAEQDGRRGAVLLRGRRATRRVGAPPRTPGGSRGGRAGCRRRPCSRRAPGRWRGGPPARRRPAARRARRRGSGARRRSPGSPSSRTPPGTVLPPETDGARLVDAARGASGPSGSSRLGLLGQELVERLLHAGPEAVGVPARSARRRTRHGPETRPAPPASRAGAWTVPGRDSDRSRVLRMTRPDARDIAALLRDGERSFSFEFFPPKDEDGEARPLAVDQRARAAAADVRLGDVRRRRHHPRPHRGDHAADRAGDLDAADGAPDLRRPHHGRRSPRWSER